MRIRDGRVTATLVLLLLIVLPLPVALAQEARTVVNCAKDTTGQVELLSPSPGEVVQADSAWLRLRGRCLGGLPFTVRVDGVGYGDIDHVPGERMEDGTLLVPIRRQAQLGVIRSRKQLLGRESFFEEISFRMEVPPGSHTLTIAGGFMGTSLPRFDPIEFDFSVGGGRLAETGFQLPFYVGLFVLTGGIGPLLVWTTRRRRLRRET